MNKNLGFYQVAVVAINKVGGPKKFIGLISGVIVLIYGVGAATGPKLIEFFKRVVKAFKGKTCGSDPGLRSWGELQGRSAYFLCSIRRYHKKGNSADERVYPGESL